LPFGGFLSREVTRPLGRIAPTRRWRLSSLRSKPRKLPRRPTSGLRPSREPVVQPAGFSRHPDSILPWAYCPLGSSPCRLDQPFGRSPLMCLNRPRRLPQTLVHFSVSIGGQLAAPCGTAPLMGFSHLAVIPRLGVCRDPGLCVQPHRHRRRCRRPRRFYGSRPRSRRSTGTPRCQDTQPSAAAADGCCLWPLQRFRVGR
jgi:hypothetical protein